MQTQNPLLFTLNIIWLDMAHCIFSIHFGNLVTLFNFSLHVESNWLQTW